MKSCNHARIVRVCVLYLVLDHIDKPAYDRHGSARTVKARYRIAKVNQIPQSAAHDPPSIGRLAENSVFNAVDAGQDVSD